MPVQKPKKSHAWILLVLGGACLSVALVMSLVVKTNPVLKQEPEEDVQPQFQAEKISATPDIGVLTGQVKPLQQTTRVVASGIHDAEFRGTKFLQANSKSYTIQVLSFSKEEVLKAFLKDRKDRQNFMYFRLTDEDQPERYVLTYGIYRNEQSAEFNLQHLNLKLPTSIHPEPQAFKSYLKYVNDLGSEEMGTNTTYEVRLKKTTLPRPQPQPITPSPTPVPTPQLSNDDAAAVMN